MHNITEWIQIHIVNPINKARYISLNRMMNWAKKRVEAGPRSSPGLQYVDPIKVDKERSRQNKIIIAAILAVACVLSLALYLFSKYFSIVQTKGITFEEWNSSAGSFWRAILGSVVAGIATISTTIMVIQRSYRMDYHRERLEAMPVLELMIISDSIAVTHDKKEMAHKVELPIPLDILYEDSQVNEKAMVFRLKNIGHGLAYGLKLEGIWGERDDKAYGGLISVGEEIWVVENELCSFPDDFQKKIQFEISYFDLYENKYEQAFIVTIEQGTVKNIRTLPPELIRKTQRIRYTQ